MYRELTSHIEEEGGRRREREGKREGRAEEEKVARAHHLH